MFEAIFCLERAGTVGALLGGEQGARRVRARVARAFAACVRFVARGYIDGDACVKAAIYAFNQIDEPRARRRGGFNFSLGLGIKA